MTTVSMGLLVLASIAVGGGAAAGVLALAARRPGSGARESRCGARAAGVAATITLAGTLMNILTAPGGPGDGAGWPGLINGIALPVVLVVNRWGVLPPDRLLFFGAFAANVVVWALIVYFGLAAANRFRRPRERGAVS